MAIQTNFPAIKPTLLLDFANTKALDPRITFTRASTATFYGTQTAKAEENLLLQSQSFATTAAWNAASNNSTVTANTTAAPDGTTTASTITDTTASSTYFAVQSVTGVSIPNAATTASVFLKSNTSQFAYLGLWDGTTYATAVVDLTGGTITSTSGSPSATSITSVGNGWYRVSVTKTINTSTFVQVGLSNSGTPTFNAGRPFYNGTASLSVFAWGAQLEQRSAVTAYTVTTTAPITNYIPVLQTAASGVARFEHNPITFESLGLEIEEQRTNLLVRSEEFDNASWTKTASTIEANTVVAPNGTLSGDKLIPDATSGTNHPVFSSPSLGSATYTASVYAKAAGYGFVYLRIDTAGGQRGGIFSITDETAGTVVNGTTLTKTNVGNGWYRLTASFTDTATNFVIVALPTGANANYAGNGYSGVFIWGAQLEAGAFPTSYIQTVASQVTRAADAASMTGTNFSSWYNQAEGTVYSEASGYNAGHIFMFDDGTTNNRWNNRFNSSASQGNSWSSNVQDIVSIFSVSGLANNQLMRTAFANKTNNAAIATNGIFDPSTGQDSSCVMPLNQSRLFIGSFQSTSAFLNGTIRKLAYYPLRVTNANLQALTS